MLALNMRNTAMDRRQSRQQGITLLETLVVVAIMSLLMALILPAVQSARESARSVQCRNNLHQIGIAAHNFNDQHGFLDTRAPLRSLLPHVGYSSLQEEFKRHFESFGSKGPRPDISHWVSPPLFVCASDPMAEKASPVLHVNYALNLGGKLFRGYGLARTSGQFRFQEAVDGLSNTAYLSEKLVSLPELGYRTVEEGRAAPLRYYWCSERSFQSGEEDAFWNYALSAEARDQAARGMSRANVLYLGDEPTYDHILPPNAWAFSSFCHDRSRDGSMPATSLHPGGVFILLLDGSVTWVSQLTDRVVYQQMGTVADRE